jgi:flagellar biogenesis protein FliO
MYDRQCGLRAKSPSAAVSDSDSNAEGMSRMLDVEALVFLMLAVLMLYYLLQRLYRQSVPADASVKEQRTTPAPILSQRLPRPPT